MHSVAETSTIVVDADYARIHATIILARGYTHWWDGHRLRRILLWAQDGRCGICGEPMDQYDVTTEHVWPRGQRGFNGPGNVVAAHRDCNSWKGGRRPTGCEIIVLVAVNARLDVPTKLIEEGIR